MFRGSPNEEKLKKVLLLFNEITVIVYLLILITLTDYNISDDGILFDRLAIALVSIIIIAFIVNLAVMIWTLLKWLCRKCRQMKQKWQSR